MTIQEGKEQIVSDEEEKVESQPNQQQQQQQRTQNEQQEIEIDLNTTEQNHNLEQNNQIDEQVQYESTDIPVIDNIEFQVFYGLNDQCCILSHSDKTYYRYAYYVLENIIKGNITQKADIQQFITNVLMPLTKSIYELNPSNINDIDVLIEGTLFILKAIVFSFMFLAENENLKPIIEAGITYNTKFYSRNHCIDTKLIYKKVREQTQEQNKPRCERIEYNQYENMYLIKDIVKLKICEIGYEKYLIDILKSSNNIIQIKDILKLFKKLFQNDAYTRKMHNVLTNELILIIKDLPLKIQYNTKQLPPNFIEKLLKTVQYIANTGFQYNESERFVNFLELEFYFVFFCSQQLQQKVTGITNIIQKINKLIDEDTQFSINYCSFYYKAPQEGQIIPSNTIYFPVWNEFDENNIKKSILEWILYKQMFEKIFNEYSHHEIIKRSYPIVRFLYNNKSLKQDQILYIYRLAVGKHHSLRSCVYSLLNNLVDIIDVEDLDLVFNEVQKTPIVEIDLETINLLRAILLNSKLYNFTYVPSQEIECQQNPRSSNNLNKTLKSFNKSSNQSNSKDNLDEELIQNVQVGQLNNCRNQNNDTDEDARSNEASNGDENQFDPENQINEDIKQSIEKRIQKNQTDFFDNPCDQTYEIPRRKYKKRSDVLGAQGKEGKGRKYRENEINLGSTGGKYVTIVKQEAIKMYEYFWQIIKKACTQYNTMPQELVDKCIEIMKHVVEHQFRPLKYDLLNKCIEMINKEEMIDQSLDFICSLNRSLPIEDINDEKVFSTSEELFQFLEQKVVFQNCVLQSIQKYKLSFVKLIQLLDDFKRMNLHNNQINSSPIPPSSYQMEDESAHYNNNNNVMSQNDNKKSQQKVAMQANDNSSSPFRNEQQQQQQLTLTNKIRQEAHKIEYLNFRILNAIDEHTLQNYQNVYKEYIETCKDRLKAVLESLRGIKRDFNVDIIKNLFALFCQNERIPQEKELFYNVLIQLVVEQRQMNKVLESNYNQQQSKVCFELINKENFSYIFNEILLCLDIQQFSAVIMNCFEAYFFYINEYVKNFVQIQGNSYVINLFEPSKTNPSSLDTQSPTNFINYTITTDQILGIDRFWQIYLTHQDQAISNHAGTIISKIILLATQYSDPEVSQKIKQLYIKEIMVQLKESYDCLAANGFTNNQANKANSNLNLFNQQNEIELLKNHYNQVLQRSLDLLNKLLKNIDKNTQPTTQLRNYYPVISIQIDNQYQSQSQEKFQIQVQTNQTIREVFTTIGERMNPKVKPEQLEAFCGGQIIGDLNKTVSCCKIQDKQTLKIHKKNDAMELDDYSMNNQAIPLGYPVDNNDFKPKEDLREKVAQIKDILNNNNYADDFIEFLLRDKKEDIGDVLNIFYDDQEVQDYEQKFLLRPQEDNHKFQDLDTSFGGNNQKNNNTKGTQETSNNNNDNILEEDKNELEDDTEAKDGKISFSKIISNHEEYFEFLFQLLEIDNPQLQQKIWDIITILPVSKKSSSAINELCQNIENSDESNWQTFLNVQNKYVILYRLQMIFKIVNCNTDLFTSGFNNNQLPNDPREREVYFQRKNFRINFVKSNGFTFLLQALISVDLGEYFEVQNMVVRTNSDGQNADVSLNIQKQLKSYQSILYVVKTYVEAFLMSNSNPQSILRKVILTNQTERSKSQNNNNSNNMNNQNKSNANNNSNQMQMEEKNQFIGPMNNPNKGGLSDEELAQMSSQSNSNKMEEMTSAAPTQNNNIQGQNQNNITANNNSLSEIYDLVQSIESDATLLSKLQSIIQLNIISQKCIEILEITSSLFAQTQELICEDMLFETIGLLQSCIIFMPSNLCVLEQFGRIQQLLVFQLFGCQSLRIRLKTFEFIVFITHFIEQNIQQQPEQSQNQLKTRQFFIKTLLGLFEQFINNVNFANCDEYIQAILSFIQNFDETQINQNFGINIQTLYNVIINGIQNRPIIETRYQNNQDKVLASLFRFAQELIIRKQSLASLNPQLIQNMIDYLFYLPGQDMDVSNFVELPKCKHRETRQAALKMILTLCSFSQENFQIVFRTIQSNQQHLQFNDQDLEVNLKPAHGFVGLKNLGCTCYINSLLQQFYMIKDFRRAILNAQIVINNQQKQLPQQPAAPPSAGQYNTSSSTMEIDEVQHHQRLNQDINDSFHQLYKEHTLYQLQNLFASMESSIKQYVWPTSLIESIKGFDGEQINVRVQQDVNEFFNRITDKLEDELKPTPQKGLLQELIGGQLSNEIISLEEEYPFLAETIEPYLTITVDIQKCKNLYEALDTQIKGDTLDGENMYFCEKYQRKIKAQKRSCIKSLPNNLVLTLKRFDFDFITMEKKKINDYFEFPLELNLRNWTKQKLFEQEGRNLNESDIHPDEYYNFQLSGVLVHNGTSESGHYYSFIKNKEDSKWYEFNDSYVREFNVENIKDECYGGKSQQVYRSQMWDESDYNKSRNAYILFYERVNPYPHRLQELVNLPIQQDLVQKIKDENREFWKSRYIFDSDYFNFVREFIFSYQFSEFKNVTSNISYTSSQIECLKWMKEFKFYIAMTENDSDYNEIDETQLSQEDIPEEQTLQYLKESQDIQILQFALQNLLENQSRSKDYQSFCQALKQIQSVLAKNVVACFWFLDIYLAQRKQLIVQLILDQFNIEIRERFQEIIIQCLENIYQVEKSYILKLKVFKRAIDFNNNYQQIENYQENVSCLYRFVSLFVQQMQESLAQNINKASNYLNIIKQLVTIDNQFIQILNDQQVTKNYMLYLNNLLKKQLNNQQHQDPNVQKNSVTLLDILAQIAIRSVTNGMRFINQCSPVFIKSNESQILVNLEPEIENSLLNYFKEYQQICYYINDPYQLFIHICWGNEQNTKKLIISLREYVVDHQFLYYNFDVAFKILKEQFDLDDGFTEMRIKLFFFSGQTYDRVFKKMEFRKNNNEQTCIEFIKWICLYSQRNPIFYNIITSQDHSQELRWFKPFLLEQAEERQYRHISYNQCVELAREVLKLYVQVFEPKNNVEDKPTQENNQLNDHHDQENEYAAEKSCFGLDNNSQENEIDGLEGRVDEQHRVTKSLKKEDTEEFEY
ncbi:ubiquitin carboxy-terminal hydrolase (macronuclear) [Tetrahymena thermophila SB210]|uniref:Ubiquitin carboxy-terminal hydrolase n=1 Tax=Tetrahymena thermophila (strain SB210) TaxID=312017 RepID=I7LT53_TETTS|nr:ubiquitin carboxy-terminal hydrolase [Tetrahymena thermophila SB210]EAR84417.2 ubiquitin carboxy-terminal hydrolase [Tetrahymena thermophila SB210]|eukprot:XP_001032080.2 ubiquitin carboxy-terminal hydrolase [Tetrahymena thermophila SB210]